MASMATHFTATLFLLPIGLRRLYCSTSHFLKNPSLFRSKSWYLSDPKWKNLDLFILTIALPVASFSEVFIFLTFNGRPTYHFSFLQQALITVLMDNENAVLKCDLEEDGLRGVALVNLLFIGHAIGVLLVSLGMFAILSSHRNSRHGETSGPLLAGLESDSTLMRTPPEFELE
ncbi:conserved hypothetical protein [Ricinus communis]|uniref:Uncharacterized protein n=1 Tax=Ricinus communis TaxID=3988 RepID=B9SQV4_RICCO|nr:conserved hypothetical protein [Ricinus communis]